VVRLLFEKGLGLEDRDEYGWTPLTAAVGDDLEALPRVRALIACGADPNAAHDRGYTVFMNAASSMERHPDVLQALIDAGADPRAVSELGYNAFHAAVDVNGEANAEESVRSTLAFLKGAGVDIEGRNKGGHTPLARAILEGTGIEVRVLAELGADPDATAPVRMCGGEACTAIELPLIFHAIEAGVGRVEKVEALLRAGASLDVADAEGRSPLEHARAHRMEVETWEDHEYKKGWLEDLDRCVEILARPRPPR
jgi:ankyrin repeat protein